MNISNLHQFLASTKDIVDKDSGLKNISGSVHVVLGNEAADVDSTVSSVVLAYYLAHSILKDEKENKSEALVLPVINCARGDIILRTEVLYFLKSHGIRVDHLICKDEVDLAAVQMGGRLKLTLVDHNVLAAADGNLQSSIERVIDHHKREKSMDRRGRDIIEPVGSCSTLVAEAVLGLFDQDALICSLLHGTIVYDTVNLSTAAGRVTSKDVKMVSELEDSLLKLTGHRPNREDVYNELTKARADISHLTPEQLLRKDAKVLRTPEIAIFIPVVPLLSKKFMELPNAVDALKVSLKANRCIAVVLMGWESLSDNEIRRDITIFSDSIHKAKQVQTPLEGCKSLQLQLLRKTSEPQALTWIYDQKNSAFSRKVMIPFLANHFETKAQSQIDVDALAGVDILMPDGEMSPDKLGQGISTIPSISCMAVQYLGVGDPISHGGSSHGSAYNSCPYTPQNSCAEPEVGFALEHYFLPSFNSREMIEKIEQKRGKLHGYDKLKDGGLCPADCSSYPFTPKNSFVDSSLDAVFEQRQLERDRHSAGGLLSAIDSEVLLQKLMEKRRINDSNYSFNHYNNNSSNSSKSQSLTKLNNMEELDRASNPNSRVSFSPSRPAQILSDYNDLNES